MIQGLATSARAISPHDKPEAAALGLDAARLLEQKIGDKAMINVVWDHRQGAYKLTILPKPDWTPRQS